MEMTVCFLLLLLCSLSTAQLQSHTDKHINASGEQTERQRRETTDASNQEQTSPPDIYAVLKDLQRKTEAQEAKLESQRAEMEKLKQQLEAQAAELVTVKSRTNVTEHQVEALRRDGEVKQVAFSASLSASGPVHFGPHNTATDLVFKHVISNIGNAYSPHTGLFTAPVRGAYHFEFYITAYGDATYGSTAALMKNNAYVFIANEHQTDGFSTSANGVTLLLEVGDVVNIRLWIDSIISDNDNHLSSFSGHLLFTM